jgi:AraC-like DNA-binding protein
MEPVAEIFSAIRIRKTFSRRLELTAPWGVDVGSKPMAHFVALIRGECVLKRSGDAEPMRLVSGDAFIIVKDEPYVAADSLASETIPCSRLTEAGEGKVFHHGGGGALSSLLVGTFDIEPADLQALKAVFPGFLKIQGSTEHSGAFESLLDMLATETAKPGIASSTVVNRLFELLFIHSIRSYAGMESALRKGWLAALSDGRLGKSVKAMHEDLSREWTVETLAEKAGMSRSSYAARFKSLVGQSPMEYLTQWRMFKAGTMLRNLGSSVLEAARQVGYDSESSFTRVFKRQRGLTPGEFRRNSPK